MVYPNTMQGGQFGGPDSLEERKRQLIQKLMGQQTGLQGTHALPLYGGVGRGSGGGDYQGGSLPQITFNPFLAMAAGRPNEMFQAPNGVTQGALAQAQAGLDPIMGGGAPGDPSAPQNIGDPGQQAGAVFTGAANPSAGGVAGSPAAAQSDPTGFEMAGGVRHLINRNTGLQPFYGSGQNAPINRLLYQ